MLRLVKVEDLLGDRDARLGYRDAVQDYVTAFDVAEAEAIRRPRSDFSPQHSSGLLHAPKSAAPGVGLRGDTAGTQARL
jgi:hypothetical protein